MHIMKNVCESLLATLFNMPDKTKDGPNPFEDDYINNYTPTGRSIIAIVWC
jgi:hypothetical protein